MKRKEEIRKLIEEDKLTYEKVGEMFNISRQRVHQIYKSYVSPIVKKEKLKTILADKIFNNIGNLPKGNTTQLTGIYGDSRNRIRELIRIRDNHTCQYCGKKWEEGKRRFDVHHLDEDKNKTRQYDKIEEADNMITLCHKCHMNIPGHRETMSEAQKVINSQIENSY